MKGWIEVTLIYDSKPMGINIRHIESFGDGFINLPYLSTADASSYINVKETYEELKQLIKEAQDD